MAQPEYSTVSTDERLDSSSFKPMEVAASYHSNENSSFSKSKLCLCLLFLVILLVGALFEAVEQHQEVVHLREDFKKLQNQLEESEQSRSGDQRWNSVEKPTIDTNFDNKDGYTLEEINRKIDELQTVIKSTEVSINDMLKYYNNNAQFLESAVSKQLHQKEIDKLIPKLLSGETFTIAAIGSSVTAGHDTFGVNASWTSHLQRSLEPVMKNAGINLKVHNRAIGGVDPYPISLCLSPLVGNDVDVIIREYEYWQLATGLNIKMQKPGKLKDMAAIESFLRFAFQLPNQPAVHFLYMEYDGRPKSTFFENWFERTEGELHDYYERFTINKFRSFAKPFDDWRRNRNQTFHSESRKNRATSEDCSEKELKDINMCPVDLEKQDGFHNRAKYLGYDEEVHPDWVEKDCHGLFVNWHPAALGHEVIGYQISYHYMRLLKEASLQLIDLLKKGPKETNEFISWARTAKQLPEAKYCENWFCDQPFQCASSFEPKDPNFSALSGWMLPDSKWERRLIYRQPNYEAMKKDVTKPDMKVKDRMHAEKTLASIDRKYALMGTRVDGPLKLKLPSNLFECVIWVHDPERPWSGSKLHNAYFNKELDFQVNGKSCDEVEGACEMNSEKPMSMLINARALVGKSCRTEPMTLTITVKPLPTERLNEFCYLKVKDDAPVCEKKGQAGRQDGFLCVQNGTDCVFDPDVNRDPDEIFGSTWLVMVK
mmetsp:Transcript_14176/g.18577  ORF Transcript_14176/g.18577 Transcript_14176/m.18577 type:complete len:712 (-) Transcript_14176:100-2235(-)